MTEPTKHWSYTSIDHFLRWVRETILDDQPCAFYWFVDAATFQFGLAGQPRIDFVEQCVTTALHTGSIPYQPLNGGDDWESDPKYGTSEKEIHDNVMNEWIASGAELLKPWTGPWFGLPKQVYPFSETKPTT